MWYKFISGLQVIHKSPDQCAVKSVWSKLIGTIMQGVINGCEGVKSCNIWVGIAEFPKCIFLLYFYALVLVKIHPHVGYCVRFLPNILLVGKWTAKGWREKNTESHEQGLTLNVSQYENTGMSHGSAGFKRTERSTGHSAQFSWRFLAAGTAEDAESLDKFKKQLEIIHGIRFHQWLLNNRYQFCLSG